MKVSKVLYNLLGGCVAVLLISYTFEQKGYQFVWSMLRRNWKVASEYKESSLSDRYQMKLGNGYAVYKYVCEKTPEDAIIYIPAAKYFQRAGVEGEPWNKLWAMRFLYPRQVVTREEYQINHRVPTHVLIVGDGGREMFPAGALPPSIEVAIVPLTNDSIQ